MKCVETLNGEIILHNSLITIIIDNYFSLNFGRGILSLFIYLEYMNIDLWFLLGQLSSRYKIGT